jgi:hypothetical protein
MLFLVELDVPDEDESVPVLVLLDVPEYDVLPEPEE